MRLIQGIIIFIFATFIIAVSLVGEDEKNDAVNPLVRKATFQKKDIPENFILNNDGKIFEPFIFPHETHIEIIGDCELCHHHSPKDETPSCKTCHGAPFNPENLELLGSKGAYHQRCLGCHKEYESGPVGCTECHEKK